MTDISVLSLDDSFICEEIKEWIKKRRQGTVPSCSDSMISDCGSSTTSTMMSSPSTVHSKSEASYKRSTFASRQRILQRDGGSTYLDHDDSNCNTSLGRTTLILSSPQQRLEKFKESHEIQHVPSRKSRELVKRSSYNKTKKNLVPASSLSKALLSSRVVSAASRKKASYAQPTLSSLAKAARRRSRSPKKSLTKKSSAVVSPPSFPKSEAVVVTPSPPLPSNQRRWHFIIGDDHQKQKLSFTPSTSASTNYSINSSKEKARVRRRPLPRKAHNDVKRVGCTFHFQVAPRPRLLSLSSCESDMVSSCKTRGVKRKNAFECFSSRKRQRTNNGNYVNIHS